MTTFEKAKYYYAKWLWTLSMIKALREKGFQAEKDWKQVCWKLDKEEFKEITGFYYYKDAE